MQKFDTQNTAANLFAILCMGTKPIYLDKSVFLSFVQYRMVTASLKTKQIIIFATNCTVVTHTSNPTAHQLLIMFI